MGELWEEVAVSGGLAVRAQAGAAAEEMLSQKR